jgi:hypothetical protein
MDKPTTRMLVLSLIVPDQRFNDVSTDVVAFKLNETHPEKIATGNIEESLATKLRNERWERVPHNLGLIVVGARP